MRAKVDSSCIQNLILYLLFLPRGTTVTERQFPGFVFKDPSALKNIFSSANSDFDVSCAKERGFENLGKGMTRCVTVS